ncbi:MAG TPA: Ig-like domain-containing protein [Gammaproteobacteria bacterium]
MRTLVTIFAVLLLGSALQGCGGATVSALADAGYDVRVEGTAPADGKSGVAQNTYITIMFSDAMDFAGMHPSDFQVTAHGAPVAGSISYSRLTATFHPSSPLEANTRYTARMSKDVRCLDGATMEKDYVWTFTTGETIDMTPPVLMDTAFGVQQLPDRYTGVVVAFFNEPMDPDSIDTQDFQLHGPGGVEVPGSIKYIGFSALFYPTGSLAPNTLYTASIGSGPTDVAGNALLRGKTWTFITPDISVLTGKHTSVTTTFPADKAADILLGTEISVTFGQTMDPTTIDAGTFRVLAPGGVPVPGSVSYTGVTAVFTPTNPLMPDTTYDVEVSQDVKSLDGIPMDADYRFAFTTGEDLAGTPPVVLYTLPAFGDQDVAPNTSILAIFDEPMDPLSLTTASFTVTAATGEPVSGVVTYTGTTAVFTPDTQLLPGVTYTGRIGTAATDLNGEPLASSYVWTFTTGSGNAASTPQILFTDPAVNDSMVSPYKKISIAFNEVMDPRTLDAGTIQVTDENGTPVPGTFTYMAFAVVFTPANRLDMGETYTVTVSGDVKDLEGIRMGSDYSWTFSTAELM